MSRNSLVLPISAVLSRPQPAISDAKPAARARAALAIRAQSLAAPSLSPILQALTVSEQLRLQHVAMRAPQGISLAQILRLLPPLLAAKIVAARGKAVLEMLLSWGKLLREQAVKDKLVQKRARQKAVQVRREAQAHDAKAYFAKASAQKAQQLDMQAMSWVDTSAGQTSARGLLVSGMNRPTLEALVLPMRTGFGLRVATLRLR